MRYRLVETPGGRVLIVRPRDNTFGHQALEVLMGLHMASVQHAAVLFRRPRRVANTALFRLVCREVWVVRGLPTYVALAAEWFATATALPTAAGEALTRWYFQAVSAAAERFPRLRAARKRAKAHLGRYRREEQQNFYGLDFRERYSHHALSLMLPPGVGAAAARSAAQLGIAPNARIVILHVRESGFKQAHGGESPVDAIRNARIASYVAAIDWLVDRGFTVIRIGDRWMTPIARRGVVDLATSPVRSDALELWFCFRSVLFIGCDSGPHCVSLLTNTPCLAVNVTNVLGGYPVRSSDRYVLKHVHDRHAGRQLALEEMLTKEYFEQRKDLERYGFIDNTSEEILEAVIEIVEEVLGGDAQPSAVQHAFRDIADGLYNSALVADRRVRKGEPAQQLLGDGFIAKRFVEQYFHAMELRC